MPPAAAALLATRCPSQMGGGVVQALENEHVVEEGDMGAPWWKRMEADGQEGASGVQQ